MGGVPRLLTTGSSRCQANVCLHLVVVCWRVRVIHPPPASMLSAVDSIYHTPSHFDLSTEDRARFTQPSPLAPRTRSQLVSVQQIGQHGSNTLPAVHLTG